MQAATLHSVIRYFLKKFGVVHPPTIRQLCVWCNDPSRDQARFVPAAIAKATQYVQVDQLLTERNSPRSIVRATGVSRRTIAGQLKKSPDGRVLLAAPAAQEGG